MAAPSAPVRSASKVAAWAIGAGKAVTPLSPRRPAEASAMDKAGMPRPASAPKSHRISASFWAGVIVARSWSARAWGVPPAVAARAAGAAASGGTVVARADRTAVVRNARRLMRLSGNLATGRACVVEHAPVVGVGRCAGGSSAARGCDRWDGRVPLAGGGASSRSAANFGLRGRGGGGTGGGFGGVREGGRRRSRGGGRKTVRQIRGGGGGSDTAP